MRRKHQATLLALGLAGALATLSIGATKGPTLLSVMTGPELRVSTLETESFGKVEILAPQDAPNALVVLVADRDHRAERDADMRALASAGAIAVTFDFDAYRSSLVAEPSDEECHYVSDDIKDLGEAVQRRLGFKSYHFPVVAGLGEGAAFAYAALAQAPENTLAGAVSIGFEPSLRADRPYCGGPKMERTDNGLYSLGNDVQLPGAWRVIASPAERQRIETFQRPLDGVEVVSAENDRAKKHALVTAALEIGRSGERGLGDLPVSVISPRGPAQALAVIISGDGGWRDIDKSIGGWLAEHGVAVVGIDSLRYFWSERDPTQVAADLDALLAHYGKTFGTTRHALIGYSFGADVLPHVWPHLAKTTRQQVSLVSLLGLSFNADFEITVEGFLGNSTAASRPIPPALGRLPLARTQCIYGAEEVTQNETACTVPELDGAERVRMNGGHHFDDDYSGVAERIYARLMRDPATTGTISVER